MNTDRSTFDGQPDDLFGTQADDQAARVYVVPALPAPAWRPATVLALAAGLGLLALGWWVVYSQALGRGSVAFALATFVAVAVCAILAAQAPDARKRAATRSGTTRSGTTRSGGRG